MSRLLQKVRTMHDEPSLNQLLAHDVVLQRVTRSLPAWSVSGRFLCRVYDTQQWSVGIKLVNLMSDLAEKANHHPDISLSYSRVTLQLTTHDAGGITEQDVALARQIESLWMANFAQSTDISPSYPLD